MGVAILPIVGLAGLALILRIIEDDDRLRLA